MRRFLSYSATAVLLALAAVLVPSSANAGLCTNCVSKMFVMNMGKCVGCGKATTSSSYQLCPACSTAKLQCEACRAALPALPPVVAPIVAPVAPSAAAPATEVKLTNQPVTPKPTLVGGNPASCGYSWVPDRVGWLGPDGRTFVAAKDKPEWAAYIPVK